MGSTLIVMPAGSQFEECISSSSRNTTTIVTPQRLLLATSDDMQRQAP